MTGGPQFGGQSMPNIPQTYDVVQNEYPPDLQYQQKFNMEQHQNSNIVGNGRNQKGDSILKQYSHNLPPHQIEYKSGFQDIPPPIYNADERVMRQKAQAKPLPGNQDLELIDFYKDLR